MARKDLQVSTYSEDCTWTHSILPPSGLPSVARQSSLVLIYDPETGAVMEMYRVESSNVEAVAYDSVAQSLWVVFVGGGLYVYKHVLPADYVTMVTSASIGGCLNKRIKGVYEYEKIC